MLLMMLIMIMIGRPGAARPSRRRNWKARRASSRRRRPSTRVRTRNRHINNDLESITFQSAFYWIHYMICTVAYVGWFCQIGLHSVKANN